jgi:polyphosphate kinase 2 PPK2
VFSFKKPSSEELDHNFLWRTSKALPERGRIGIFNRSHHGGSPAQGEAASPALSRGSSQISLTA